ncbi:MAG: hypothetical protein Unbinned4409contig1001_73 [Prokaryotic dsDNA virus sp.]|nr:MAG: hypothetical protein Unbinned4409contig1001_73 [Prokaryotic dsDNA virus sp.]|tara:strand:+ start:1220 stop:1417 length:198 start_codon:yes stop_codon:yes gene_type:complete
MMKRISNRSLKLLNFTSLMGVCCLFLPFGYFGEWAMVLAWLVSMCLWIESDFEQGRRGLHPNGNV